MNIQSSYNPLAAGNTIRILELQPCASFDTDVKARLPTVSLDDADLRYDALSWCWGPPNEEATIVVDKQNFSCRRNLQAALRHLRKHDSTLSIWVDAICINQDDVSERNHQVQMMGKIYERAETVQIWLGEASDNSDEGLALLESLQAGISVMNLGPDGGCITEVQIMSFNALLQRPWFERIWVLQEFTLGKRRVMHCGKASCVVQDVLALEKMGQGICDDVKKHLHGALDHIPLEKLLAFIDCFGRISPFIDQAMKMQEGYANFAGHRVVSAIVSASSCKATDLRDMVYGCFGLLPTFVPFLPVEYRLSIDELFTLATFALIGHHIHWLHILCFLHESPESTSITDYRAKLPSWACDFSKALQKQVVLWVHFKATRRHVSTWQHSLEYPNLSLSGAYFDEIVSCQPTSLALRDERIKDISWLRKSKQTFCHSVWRAFFRMCHEASDRRAYTGGGTLENAYRRTLVCDITLDKGSFGAYNRLTSEEIAHASAWMRDPGSESLLPSAPDFETHKLAAVHVSTTLRVMKSEGQAGNYLFTTRRGYIGQSVGRRSIEVGDRLYFFDGGEVPWALRPVPGGTALKMRCECYVHGIMDGEALQPPVSERSKARKRHELWKAVFGVQSLDVELPVTNYGKVVIA